MRPASICGTKSGTPLNIISTWPPMVSVSAGELPLYGTCTMFTPAISLKSSPAIWFELPRPDDA